MAAAQAETFDAIVVGGGHNGLVAAAYLARSGARTLILEARATTGGAATTEAPWPGAGQTPLPLGPPPTPGAAEPREAPWRGAEESTAPPLPPTSPLPPHTI